MSYLHDIPKDEQFVSFVAANGDWLAMMWDRKDSYWTANVAMWAVCKTDNSFFKIYGVIGDNDIGGQFNLVGGDEDYFIGYIEPNSDPPDDNEIMQRIEIIKEMLDEKREEESTLESSESEG